MYISAQFLSSPRSYSRPPTVLLPRDILITFITLPFPRGFELDFLSLSTRSC